MRVGASLCPFTPTLAGCLYGELKGAQPQCSSGVGVRGRASLLLCFSSVEEKNSNIIK